MLEEFYRQLGSTGLRVSPLALGTVKIGRNTDVKYPESFQLPDDDQVRQILETASTLGINLIDTAPAYGASEERLGKLMDSRHDWLLCSKAGEFYEDGHSRFDFSKAAILKSIEQSLLRLNTDYLDLLLIHSDGNDLDILNNSGALEALATAKTAGKIRHTGMSVKSVEGGLEALSEIDVLMVTLNKDDESQRPVISEAAKRGKGILLKKVFASGHTDPETGLKLAFDTEGVSTIVMGTINPAHLEENARIAAGILGNS